MIVAQTETKKNIKAAMETLGHPSRRNEIIILSPIRIQQNSHKILIDVFPLWLEYYRHEETLNNPLKIVVIGCWGEYEKLPYYLGTFDRENIWLRLERMLSADAIDYSTIPSKSSGKRQISVFFHGHGEKSLRAVLSGIKHYVNNGIAHFNDSGNRDEAQSFFFESAKSELNKLKDRLQKYKPILSFLPWKREIAAINRMIKEVDRFLIAPFDFPGNLDDLQGLVNDAWDRVSNLMRIHGISEADRK